MKYEQTPQSFSKKEKNEKDSNLSPETRELSFSAPNKIVSYNLSKSPERIIDEDERKKLEGIIDFDYIKKEANNWKDYLAGKIKNNNVLLLGEAHTAQMAERNEITNFLETAKENGVTHIGLEIEEYYQEAFDKFIETGKFADEDNPKDYEKVFEFLSLLKDKAVKSDKEPLKELMDFEKRLYYENFLFKQSLQHFYPILKEIRELNLKVMCLDSNHRVRTNPKMREEVIKAREEGKLKEYYQEMRFRRDSTMFENTKKGLGDSGKMLILMGALHTARGDRENEEYKSLGSLLQEDQNINSFAINLDRDFDGDPTNTAKKKLPDINLNSVLFTAMEKQEDWKGKRFGIDLNENILKGEKCEKENFPFDGYIKL